MKTVYILAVVCIATTHSFKNEETFKPEALVCAEESKFNLDFIDEYMQQLPDGNLNASEEFYRFMACVFVKLIDSSKGQRNIHDVVMDRINYLEKMGDFKNKSFTRDEIERVANRCAREGLNDVDYLKCTKIYEQPFASLEFF